MLFREAVYQAIKANREVPADKAGTCAGILTAKETDLFDEVVRIASDVFLKRGRA